MKHIFMLSILLASHIQLDIQARDVHLRHSEGTRTFKALGGHSDTWALRHLDTRTLRALRHLGTSGTHALRYSCTWALRALRHSGTQGTQALGHVGTRGTLFSRLFSPLFIKVHYSASSRA